MNELLKRCITGIIYVFLLLTAIMLSNAEAFGFLFLVFGLVCLFEFKRLVRLTGSAIYLIFLGIWWCFNYLIPISEFGGNLFVYLLLLPLQKGNSQVRDLAEIPLKPTLCRGRLLVHLTTLQIRDL